MQTRSKNRREFAGLEIVHDRPGDSRENAIFYLGFSLILPKAETKASKNSRKGFRAPKKW